MVSKQGCNLNLKNTVLHSEPLEDDPCWNLEYLIPYMIVQYSKADASEGIAKEKLG